MIIGTPVCLLHASGEAAVVVMVSVDRALRA
jgi:hypothetical protein